MHTAQNGIQSNGECNTHLTKTVDNEPSWGWYEAKYTKVNHFKFKIFRLSPGRTPKFLIRIYWTRG